MSQTRVGVIGLGAMGRQIALHLLRRGFVVAGFDVRGQAITALQPEGLIPTSSAAEVARDATVVITSLPTADSLIEATTGVNGVVEGSHPGLVLLETSTVDLAVKQRLLDVLRPRGVAVLDSPISGTSSQLASRDVVVYASGDPDLIHRASPVIEAFSRELIDVGPFGNGTLMKLVSNLLVTIHTVAAAEALVAAERLGLDRSLTLAALASGGGGSRMLDVRGPMMVRGEYEPPFARLADFIKDIRLISDLEASSGFLAPLFDACVPLYDEALAEGWGDADHAAVVELFRGRQR
jgi:3-hydroxyisobutyrate dehydrogenase-like beta-hydroxyacid dehydrogenase